jgi:acetolactate synthase-1/2/3 large subunit
VLSNAAPELERFAKKINAPAAISLMGQGTLKRAERLNLGMIGMHGSVASNRAVQNADLLITIGARFSDRVTSRVESFAKNASILHFDIDPAEINKNIRSSACISGDIKKILSLLCERLAQIERPEWLSKIEEWRSIEAAAQKSAQKSGEDGGFAQPRFIVEEAARIIGSDSIVVSDVGQHQMWTSQFFPFERPRQFLTSGGLGTMGFGLGAALGAKAALPDKNVILFTGDGSFRMNCAELGTLAAYKMPVLVIIFNNGVLGMVRQWQNLFYEKRFSETALDRPPDFSALAAAYGAVGFRAENKNAFAEALLEAKKVLAGSRCAVIDVRVGPDEMVLPMVPGGSPIDEQILS